MLTTHAGTADDDAPTRLQFLLDALPPSQQPLDASGLDGFMCGVLVQARPIAERVWWPHVLDIEARPAPPIAATAPLREVVMRRHAELAAAIAARRWFDPWVFEHEPASAAVEGEAEGAVAASVRPWAFGFSLALERFPGLLERDDEDTTEALALVYRHLGVEHLDDAEELQARIEALEPLDRLDAAVEELVRATLLLADAAANA